MHCNHRNPNCNFLSVNGPTETTKGGSTQRGNTGLRNERVGKYSHCLDVRHISEQGVSSPHHSSTVKIYKADVIVVRDRQRSNKPQRKGGGRRQVIGHISKDSQRRLRFTLRNGLRLRSHLTLTYPGEFPTNGRVLKRQITEMRRWLVGKGYSGVWIVEFQERGAPHLHLLLTSLIPLDDVRRKWLRVIYSDSPATSSAHIAGIKHLPRTIGYVTKGGAQKQVPESFEGLGRWWSAFGGYKPILREAISGETPAVAPLVRTAVRLWQSRNRFKWKKFRDRGVGRMSFYGLSKALLTRLSDLLENYKISHLRRVQIGAPLLLTAP